MDKTSFKIFIGCLFVSILICGGLLMYSFQLKDEEEINVKYVDNPIMFFTVENCVNKYIKLIVSEDSYAIYEIIDDKYKEDQGININNVLANNIKLPDGQYSFITTEMLEDKDKPYTYYVKGYLLEEIYDEFFTNNRFNYELIVKLNISEGIFSVIPKEVGDYFEKI